MPQLGGTEKTENGIGHLGRIEADQKSCFIIEDKLLRPAATGRDDRATAGHRLKCGDAKAFLMRRHHEQIKSAQLVAQCLNWDIAAELDGVTDTEFLYPMAQLLTRLVANQKRAHRVTGSPEMVQGGEQQLQILARIAKSSREADASTKPLIGCWAEEVRIDRDRQHILDDRRSGDVVKQAPRVLAEQPTPNRF